MQTYRTVSNMSCDPLAGTPGYESRLAISDSGVAGRVMYVGLTDVSISPREHDADIRYVEQKLGHAMARTMYCKVYHRFLALE